jgi:hypothetical protein
MANCPNCGSEHIQMTRETNVSWGRAVAGWALFGVVGGAVGAVTGEDRNVNSCLDCGTSWKAADLYKTLQVIKQLTDLKLDLSMDNHRAFMNEVIPEITIYSDSISEVNKETELKTTSPVIFKIGVSISLLVGFILSIWVWSTAGSGWGFLFLIFGVLGCYLIGGGIAILLHKIFSGTNEEKRISKINQDSEEKKSKIERLFRTRVKQMKIENGLLSR